MKRWILLLVAALICLANLPATGAGFIIVDDAYWRPGPIPPHPVPPPWPPHPMPPRPPLAYAPLELSSVRVDTRINDQLATTTVHQEFFNPNPTRLEGTFVFPIPKGAHLDKFSMEIDGRTVEAELLSAEKARRIYEDIVRKLRDPALLEFADRDVFKARIFPIEPNSRKKITLTYSQLLKADNGLIGYVLPLAAEKLSAAPVKNVSVKVELQTKRPLKSIYSPSHNVEIKRDGPTRATAGYEATEVAGEADFALYFAPEKDEIGINLLTQRGSEGDGYFLLLASPGVDVPEKKVIERDVVFVLDTSGSMAGKKLDQAKKALTFCIANLNAGDRFEIMRFSTEVEPLFDHLVPASEANRDRADKFVKELRPMGGTALDEALTHALTVLGGNKDHDLAGGSDRAGVVIFLTDGQPTIGVTDEKEIVGHLRDHNPDHLRVFCFGIGTDVNTHLLDKVTEETRAVSQYVLPEEDLEVKVSSFYAKIKEPVLANPSLRFTGDLRATKLYPSPLPDVFKGDQLVLVGRYSGQGPAAVIIEGTVNGQKRQFTYETTFPASRTENEFIPRLWATRRVGYLLDEIRLHGENAELRDEVTDLARQYGIVTPYTAYLIVEDEARRDVPQAMRSMQNFDADTRTRSEAAQAWNSFKDDRAGELAVAGARYGMALKAANAPAAAAASGMAENSRALGYGGAIPSGSSLADDGKARQMRYSQQNQFVAGKNFFQNNAQWVDSAIQQNAKAKQVRIQFGSSEYFHLVATNSQVLPWVALGRNVQFVVNDTAYDIYE